MLLDLFNKCTKAQYVHIEENSADFAVEKRNKTLYVYLQWSKGKEDWKNNFDFAAKPYKDMGVPWKAHRGFVKVWKTIEPYLKNHILETDIDRIIVVGYSHGAAITVLAHEYIWFNRPDIRDNCYSFAFESPRVFYGWTIPDELKERWKNLFVFRNNKDIVTHLPPAFFGYKHVGNFTTYGEDIKDYKPVRLWKIKMPRCISDHIFDNVRLGLTDYDSKLQTADPALYKIMKRINI